MFNKKILSLLMLVGLMNVSLQARQQDADMVSYKDYVEKPNHKAKKEYKEKKEKKEIENTEISNVFLDKTEYSKIEQLKLELKSKAILKAKSNAKFMTEPLGQKVGKAIFISDNNNVLNSLSGQVAGLQIRGMNAFKESKFETLDIEFQKIKVETELNAKFIIE